MAEVSTTTPGFGINDPSQKVVRTRSTFPQMSYDHYHTDRFGEYTPFFVMEGVEGDKIPVRSSHDVRSMSLKAPLMQDVKRNKDFYLVPMEAILPFNWEKFYTNPVIGDDVPDDCGCGVDSFWSKSAYFCNAQLLDLRTILADANTSDSDKLTAIFRFLVFLEYMYSDGNLITLLGCHSSLKFRGKILDNTKFSTTYGPLVNGGFDAVFDHVCSSLKGYITKFTALIDGQPRDVYMDYTSWNASGAGVTDPAITFHDFLQYLRDDLNVSVSSIVGQPYSNWINIINIFDSTAFQMDFSAETDDYNLSRLWAYQLCCSHFYSNDHVDFIYSAELFRTLIGQYCRIANNNYNQVFIINGTQHFYDYLSAKYYTIFINYVNNFLLGTSNSAMSQRGYFSALFGFRRSLRFVDYFTGSRTRPLAVGNVDVNVVSNKVNIIDVTQNIQRQRFFNAVNRFGRKFREYIDGLSGVTPAVDYHNPLYLGHTADNIFGIEVENTGSAQISDSNSITSRLQSNGARYQFDIDVDRPCVVIGISYYDIQRVYITTTDRQLFHMNRFDMFNPFMQFIGDQEVYIGELGSKRYFSANWTFAYQLRHMEYKQRFPVASGGFCRALPGWIFDNRSDDDRALQAPTISDDFIRSLNSEIDRFFVSLTGYSLGTYFHFEVADHNDCEPSRPMAYAPSIL